jgi:hypothetical protein
VFGWLVTLWPSVVTHPPFGERNANLCSADQPSISALFAFRRAGTRIAL